MSALIDDVHINSSHERDKADQHNGSTVRIRTYAPRMKGIFMDTLERRVSKRAVPA